MNKETIIKSIAVVICLTLGLATICLKVHQSNLTKDEETITYYNENDNISKELTEKTKDYNLLESYNKNFNELSNQEILYFGLIKLGTPDEFTLKELQDIITKYLATSFTPENIECRTELHQGDEKYYYLYDSNTETFKLNDKHPGHGGGGIINIEHSLERFSSLQEENGTYTLTIYKAYANSSSDVGPGALAYYNSPNTLEEKDKLFDITYEETNEGYNVTNDINSEFTKIANSHLSKVKYVFISNDNNYILKDFTFES